MTKGQTTSEDTRQLELIRRHITTVPDYPKPGINFRDVTTLIANPEAYAMSIKRLAAPFLDKKIITKVVGPEARGFLFAAPVALALGVGFVPVRKVGKLPRKTIKETYELEYGSDEMEIHRDSISSGDNVLVVDDLLATGGTIEATVRLINRLGGIVTNAAFVIDLPDLKGAKHLSMQGVDCYSLISFASH